MGERKEDDRGGGLAMIASRRAQKSITCLARLSNSAKRVTHRGGARLDAPQQPEILPDRQQLLCNFFPSAMSQPDPDTIRRVTRDIITKASDNGTLEELTPRLVRKEVEIVCSYEEGELDDAAYKAIVKEATAIAMAELENKITADEAKNDSDAKRKRPKSSKSQSKKSTAKEKKAAKEDKPATKKANKRSASVVPSSSDEDTTAPAKSSTNARAKTNKAAVLSDVSPGVEPEGEPPRKRQKKVAGDAKLASKSEAEPSSKAKAAPLRSPIVKPDSKIANDPRPESSAASPPDEVLAISGSNGNAEGDKSELEMSVLIDEPKQSHKKKGKEIEVKTRPKKEAKERKGKQPVKELSKDEETIKRLKSFVVACGVRKAWAREFKNLDSPSEQIKRLKTILADLGMTGRMSMEQAKAIRAKRELAQELEDVQTFEKSVVSGPAAGRNKKKDESQRSSSDEESDGNVAEAPKRRSNARQSIMAFLGDQSDDD
ncbi:uncharacterized protein FIBRA_04775 [Fibroporia radiculosa]|uniref:Uncharacterized protein n=1 Tax=Fibroporia radiculosa TaxID=599839 RepID=J4GPS9_9APHY|nr:uncharacterized protein FIBRA_04775 [Fibroporia radiculosa]CCM02670.1 predicted protein [Fibroporia radiculosa]